MKTISPHLGTSQYMSPYSSQNRPTIHDRRQSVVAGHGKLPNTPPLSDKSRPDYTSQGHPSFTEEVSNTIQASQSSAGSWDPAQSSTQPVQDNQYSTVQPNLPPLSEALSASSPSMAVSPPMQTQQATFPTMNNVVASPPNFYAPNPYLEMQAPVNVYPSQDQLESDPSRMQPHGIHDRHSISGQPMMPQDSSSTSSSGYVRRVTYPFVSSLETGAGLVMSNVISSEPAGSSPLSSHNQFTHSGLVGVSPVSVQGMPRTSPTVDYMDSLALQQQVHTQAPTHHHHAQAAAQSQAAMHPITWSQNGGGSDMSSVDGSVNGSKVYSFVPLSGVNSKKRPRRRFDEIERLYVCNWGDCEKAYGTLNHLNAHVNMQKHGPKRLPAEFKELRKAWRKHKRAEEEAAKQAAAFHHQQTQTQQAQLHQQQQQQHQQQSLCDPILTHMHPAAHHQLAMHAMSHHQPHQLPHPHAHPNQHPHPHTHAHHPQSQHHNHPMGF
ncbi:hypothetical protein BGZ80_001520 [Entomortierella chlamydospora]|uniref:C2H2-type domain-containing protein n=1 Tax=Entomortierella chlamydospora TaxID=101097 RepID=A0A9P6MRX0_9FUNG|nr:hypothetical protein BGZ79_008813 [Entomortierella chlamydospora]KAG0010387.1 hypothetical protein BGZ80_001520 [Entomortierella chlamydospora]